MLRRAPHLVAALMVSSLIAAGCSDNTGSDSAGSDSTGPDSTELDSTEPDEAADATPDEAALEATVTVTASQASPIAARVDIETSVPATAQITATAADHEVATPVTSATATSHSLPLVGLREDRTYDLAVTVVAETGDPVVVEDSFTTGSVDIGLPDFNVERDPQRSSPGITVLELNPVAAVLTGEGTPMVGLDEDGELVWYYRGEAFVGALQRTPWSTVVAQNNPFGMSEFEVNGEAIRAWYPDPEGDDEPSVGDDGATSIPYHADWIDLRTVHHDVWPMEDGTLLFLSTTVHPLTDEQRAIAACADDDNEWQAISDVVVHMDPDGTVLRTWDLWDAIRFEDHPGHFLCNQQGLDATPTERDWTHANALVYDPDRDAIIVSVRHTDHIVAFEMTDELGPQTGVRWIMGPAGTIDYAGESFHHTHGVKVVGNGDLLLYDNGNFRPGTTLAGGSLDPYSRALRIQVNDQAADPAEWSATQIWEHRMIDDVTGRPAYSSLISDADELANGNVLVTHGGIGEFDGGPDGTYFHTIVAEVVPDPTAGGDIAWELRLGTEEAPVTMYRADRWDSLYWGSLWAD